MKIEPCYVDNFNKYRLKLKMILSGRFDNGNKLKFHGVQNDKGKGILVIGKDSQDTGKISKFYSLQKIDKLFNRFEEKVDSI